jgi:hypothetical protein
MFERGRLSAKLDLSKAVAKKPAAWQPALLVLRVD